MKRGDVVIVCLYDGRKMKATVVGLLDTVAGLKIRVRSGDLLLTVNPDQVAAE